MEKRVIVAIVLSILVMVGFQMIVFKNPATPPVPEPVPEAVAAQSTAAPGKALVTAPVEQAPAQAAAAAGETLPALTAEAEERIVVETSLYRAEWSNNGGVLLSWRLKKHKNEARQDLDLVPQRAAETGRFPFSFWTEDADFTAAANSGRYKVTGANAVLADGAKAAVKFEYSDGKNVRVEKTFLMTGGTYELGIEIRAWKGGQEIKPGLVWGPGIGNPSPAEMKQRFSASTGAAVLASGKVLRMDERKFKPGQNAFTYADWAAYEENYFTALFVLPKMNGSAVFEKDVREDGTQFFLAVNNPSRAFIGPKDIDALKAFGHDSKKIINFGFFGAIAEVLLVTIKYIHGYVPNWGLAIILMTFIIKIIFFPLTYSSTKSMAKMQELQPKIKAMRAKYKKAKQDINQRRQMNEEMMKLYKEHGVNPAGGCLPMLIQLPVFWGVFRMLVVAVEFRHSPFAFWIKDLSVKDPYYITPILMGMTQFIQQKMTPSSADPTQARMMLIMPVIMTFFFMNFQSGLILYWLATNVLQIGQQAIMNRMMSKKKREDNGKRRKD